MRSLRTKMVMIMVLLILALIVVCIIGLVTGWMSGRLYMPQALEGKKPLTDAKSALTGLRIIWKMYEAEKNGMVADLRGLGLDG